MPKKTSEVNTLIYYVAGIPYSDELYHHGIKNQKWGVRRYQNPDGSLTALGRIHYGVGKAIETTGKVVKTTGKVIGNAAVSTGKAVGNAVKAHNEKKLEKKKLKHPELMTDQELREYTNRLNMEASYKEAKKRNRGPVRKVVGDILQKAGNKIVDRALNELTNKIFDKPDKTTDYEAVLKDPKKFSDKEVADATKRMANINAMEKMPGSSAKSESKSDSPKKDTPSDESAPKSSSSTKSAVSSGKSFVERLRNIPSIPDPDQQFGGKTWTQMLKESTAASKLFIEKLEDIPAISINEDDRRVKV